MFRVATLCIVAGLTALVPAISPSSSGAAGNHVSQDGVLPVHSLHKAVDRDNAVAEEKIGDLWWHGTADHPRDRTEAVRHYDNAANLGIASAERKLAIAFANGDGTPADDAQMLRWQRKAAEAGDAMAAGMLGYAIMIGLDGTYDMVEAATWLTIASETSGSEEWRSHSGTYAKDARSRLTKAEHEAFRVRLAYRRSTLNGE